MAETEEYITDIVLPDGSTYKVKDKEARASITSLSSSFDVISASVDDLEGKIGSLGLVKNIDCKSPKDLVSLANEGKLEVNTVYVVYYEPSANTYDHVPNMTWYNTQKYYDTGKKFEYMRTRGLNLLFRADSSSTLSPIVRFSVPPAIQNPYFNKDQVKKWIAVAGIDEKAVWIERLIDDYGNDCLYDFKNLIFNGNSSRYGDRYTFNVEDEDTVGTTDASLTGMARNNKLRCLACKNNTLYCIGYEEDKPNVRFYGAEFDGRSIGNVCGPGIPVHVNNSMYRIYCSASGISIGDVRLWYEQNIGLMSSENFFAPNLNIPLSLDEKTNVITMDLSLGRDADGNPVKKTS